jgi:hypothetical protein
MSTRNIKKIIFVGSKVRLVHGADNLTAINCLTMRVYWLRWSSAMKIITLITFNEIFQFVKSLVILRSQFRSLELFPLIFFISFLSCISNTKWFNRTQLHSTKILIAHWLNNKYYILGEYFDYIEALVWKNLINCTQIFDVKFQTFSHTCLNTHMNIFLLNMYMHNLSSLSLSLFIY